MLVKKGQTFMTLIKLPRYDLVFSRMLAYSQDFISLVGGLGDGGDDRSRLRQREGVQE
jgi:hypothetical protein